MKRIMCRVMLGEASPSEKSKYMWFTLGSFAFALSTLLMTVIMSRAMGEVLGGMFSFGLSLAQWLSTIAYFELRTYQVTDVKNEYAFKDYFTVKIILCISAFLINVIYALVNGYENIKIGIIILIAFYKILEAFAEVFDGEFQKQMRVDAAGKSLFFRTMCSMVTLVIFAYATKDIILSLVAMNIVAIISVVFFDFAVIDRFSQLRISFSGVKPLLMNCFPLAVSNFLSTYITNASKLAVDNVLGDVWQLRYTAVFMPNFVINLISNIIFKPMQTSMAIYYDNRDMKKFWNVVYRLVILLLGFTAVCMLGGYFLGIPVLSFLYNTDLSNMKGTLVILLLCGGINAINIVLYYVFAIIRKQKTVTVMYICVALMAFFFMSPVIERFGINGAAYGYLFAVVMLLIIMVAYLAQKFPQDAKRN